MILALAALPALGNLVGGLLAEFVRVSERVLSLALHAAVGVVMGVVAVELVPTAIAGIMFVPAHPLPKRERPSTVRHLDGLREEG